MKLSKIVNSLLMLWLSQQMLASATTLPIEQVLGKTSCESNNTDFKVFDFSSETPVNHIKATMRLRKLHEDRKWFPLAVLRLEDDNGKGLLSIGLAGTFYSV